MFKKKKIKKLLIGTNNEGKLKEIRDLLPKRVKIFSVYDFGIKSPIENGKTFRDNSLIKSRYFSKKTKFLRYNGIATNYFFIGYHKRVE